MALIKCPECNGQVSDRAEVCIHCGYPLGKDKQGDNGEVLDKTIEENSKYQEEIKNEIIMVLEKSEYAMFSSDILKAVSEKVNKNIDSDFIEQALATLCQENKIKVAFNGCLKYEIASPVKSVELSILGSAKRSDNNEASRQMNKDAILNQTVIKCPKCGSTQIQMVPRKWSLLTGFLTNKVDRVCMNCKHKF